MQSKVTELAQACGATYYSPAPMRAVRGLSFTYEQLEDFAQRLAAERNPCLHQISEPAVNNSESPNGCYYVAKGSLDTLSEVHGDCHAPMFTSVDALMECFPKAIPVALYADPAKAKLSPLAPFVAGCIADTAGYVEADSRADFINGLRHGEQAHGIIGKCQTCNDNGLIGGPSFHAPDEGGEPCPDCTAPATESVLIDGTAYEVHADVAAELLRLHIELQQSTAPANVWQQAVDMELVSAHLGIAGNVTFEQAAKSLNELIRWNIEVATNPATNGGKVLVPAAVAVPDGWTPTVENINALPDPLRVYIHALETNADPSGMVRDNTILREQLAGLQIMFRKSQDALAATPSASAVPDGWKRVPVVCTNEICCAIEREIDSQLAASGIAGPMHRQDGAEIWNAALAATPAAGFDVRKSDNNAAAPVVLPEPVAYMLLDKDEPKTGFIFAKDSGGEWHGSTPLYTEQQLRGLLGNDAPAGSGGWKIHAENMERDRNYWRDRAQTMHEHQKGECWYWQGDGNDNPESMVNSLPVVIRADVLRALLATGGQAQAVERSEVLVTVSGFTGSGKSAIAGEIEILCRALGLQVEWPDGDSEKNMTHADWTAALEQYKPRVRIVEQNLPFAAMKGMSK